MKKMCLVAAAVSTALVAAPALAVDYFGYFRAGTGISSDGAGDIGINKQKIGRLGNESDNYSEFGFGKTLRNDDQKWRVESMIASGNSGTNAWQDGDFNIAQYNVQATGLFAFDKEATLWAGKRYYQRKDVHITDFYFLNTSGTGGGIENLSVGNQKLSLAILEDSGSEQTVKDDKGSDIKQKVTGYIADIRLANIGLWEGASLELAGAYNFATGAADSGNNTTTNTVADDGVLGTAIVHQNMSSGFNQTVLQYGTNAYGAQMADLGNGGSYDRSGDQNGAKGYRILNHGVVSLGESWEMGHQLLFAQSTDTKDSKYKSKQKGDHELTSAVVRPMYMWNDTMRTIFEGGAYQETLQDNGKLKGSKVTVAQAWAMDAGFFARPEIRVYTSHIKEESTSTLVSKAKKEETVVGVQVEAWF